MKPKRKTSRSAKQKTSAFPSSDEMERIGTWHSDYIALHKRMEEYELTKNGYSEVRAVHFSFSGDAYAMQQLARMAHDSFLDNVELTPALRVWCTVTAWIIGESRAVATAISKDLIGQKRGAPRSALKAYNICTEVAAVILDGATSVEEAWQFVAEKHHLDIATVKGYWIEHKSLILDGLRIANAHQLPHISGQELVAGSLRINRAKKRRNSSSE